jgi:hypothetical protein
MTKIQILIIMLPPVATIIAVVIGVLLHDFRLGQIDGQILGMRSRLSRRGPALDKRFDEMRDMVRDDLRQFTDRIDSRLRRLAER